MYYQMQALKWDPWFITNIETILRLAWISMSDFLPNFFVNEAPFFITFAIENH